MSDNSPQQVKDQVYQPKSKTLDYTGIGIELYRYYAEKKEKPDWDAIAEKFGSASGNSVNVNWKKLVKAYEGVPMTSPGKGRSGPRKSKANDVLKPNPMKVVKTTKKKNGGGDSKKGKAKDEQSDEDVNSSIKVEADHNVEGDEDDLAEDEGLE
ncbi:hypothetical protein MMC10_000006 [Thelotrema lepadinum]|nr:hypothetical protein [Thelotrema lepadinum]